MGNDFMSKAKADGQMIAKTVAYVTKLGKLKLAIKNKKGEKDKVLKLIGVTVFRMFSEDRTLTSDKLDAAISSSLAAATDIDRDIQDLEEEIEETRSAFRATGMKEPPEATK